MENQIIHHEMPDSPASVLSLFSTSKEGINSFASKIINEVEDGYLDPLKVKLWCKTLTEIADKIDKATKEHQRREAERYGDKPFDYAGAELHYLPVHTEYNYDNCGDEELQDLKQTLESSKDAVKKREEFLRSLSRPTAIVSRDGEAVTINPPVKKQTMGVKVSIK